MSLRLTFAAVLLLASCWMDNVAVKDGTVIGAIFMGAVVEPLFGQKPRTTHDTS
jgi:hypothetical protein